MPSSPFTVVFVARFSQRGGFSRDYRGQMGWGLDADSWKVLSQMTARKVERDDPRGLSNRRDNILQLARPQVDVGVVFPFVVAPFFDVLRDGRLPDSDVIPLIKLS